MTAILGISCFYHDSAAALIIDGEIVAAAQEERFTRLKHDASFPHRAIEYVLSEAGLTLSEVAHVAFYDKPFLKFERLIETYAAVAPQGFKSFSVAMPVWLREKHFQKSLMRKELRSIDKSFSPGRETLLFAEHHMSHAASAFYPSPFEEAVVLTLDGCGEWATATVAIGRGKSLEIVKEIHFPHSLGMLYSAVTYYLGFKVNSGEYKVMGLAPYGEPKFVDQMRELITLKEKGQYELNLRYFDFLKGEKMYSDEIATLFGVEPRVRESEILQVHQDIAKSLQVVLEEVMLNKAIYLHELTGSKNLCMAGGVALNCVANGKILRDGPFEKLFVQPAANDAGCALGAAALAYQAIGGTLKKEKLPHVYLGPKYTNGDIQHLLNATSLKFKDFQGKQDDLMDALVERLKEGQVIGWYHGRLEFGPRSLGARSILADP